MSTNHFDVIFSLKQHHWKSCKEFSSFILRFLCWILQRNSQKGPSRRVKHFHPRNMSMQRKETSPFSIQKKSKSISVESVTFLSNITWLQRHILNISPCVYIRGSLPIKSIPALYRAIRLETCIMCQFALMKKKRKKMKTKWKFFFPSLFAH